MPVPADPPISDSLDRRLTNLSETFQKKDAAAISGVLLSLADRVREVFGDELQDHSAGLLDALSKATRSPSTRTAFQQTFGGQMLKFGIYRTFLRVAIYGDSGLTPDGATRAERELALAADLKAGGDFLRAIPFRAWGIDPSSLEDTLAMAEARWAIDAKRPVHPRGLALLAGISQGRLRNLMTARGGLFQPRVDDKHVSAEQAAAWLAKRRGFRPTLWEPPGTSDGTANRDADQNEALFVPVGKGGATFHPGLRRGAYFRIGSGKNQVKVGEFDDALRQLQKMADPVWLHRSKTDWVLVRATRWARLSRHQLTKLSKLT